MKPKPSSPTGRSSTDRDRLNLQNIPMRTELGRQIRKGLFRPILQHADISELERRIRERWGANKP